MNDLDIAIAAYIFAMVLVIGIPLLMIGSAWLETEAARPICELLAFKRNATLEYSSSNSCRLCWYENVTEQITIGWQVEPNKTCETVVLEKVKS